jgi:hypothetical protein
LRDTERVRLFLRGRDNLNEGHGFSRAIDERRRDGFSR